MWIHIDSLLGCRIFASDHREFPTVFSRRTVDRLHRRVATWGCLQYFGSHPSRRAANYDYPGRIVSLLQNLCQYDLTCCQNHMGLYISWTWQSGSGELPFLASGSDGSQLYLGRYRAIITMLLLSWLHIVRRRGSQDNRQCQPGTGSGKTPVVGQPKQYPSCVTRRAYLTHRKAGKLLVKASSASQPH